MNQLQTTVIIVLALAACVRVFMFDKRGRTHKPIFGVIAYLIFLINALLVLSASIGTDSATEWLLILGLAVHTGTVLYAGGNVAKIHTTCKGQKNEIA